MEEIRINKNLSNTPKWTLLCCVYLFLSAEWASAGQFSSGQTSPSTTTTSNVRSGVSDYHRVFTMHNAGVVDGLNAVPSETTNSQQATSDVIRVGHGITTPAAPESTENPQQTSHFDKETRTSTPVETTEAPDPSDGSRIINPDVSTTAPKNPSSEGTTVSLTSATLFVSTKSTTVSYEWQVIQPGYVTDCQISRRMVPNAGGKYAIKMTKQPRDEPTAAMSSFNKSICSIGKLVSSEFSMYVSTDSASWEPFSGCKIYINLCKNGKKCDKIPITESLQLQEWRYQVYRLPGRKGTIELTAEMCSSFNVEIHYRVVRRSLFDTLPVINTTSPNSAYVISPGFEDDKHYPNNLNLTLSITVAANEVILLSFLHFNLETATPTCRFDWLQLTCVNTSGDYLVWQKCGRQDIPSQVFQHTIKFRFSSDWSVQMSGFKILYTILPRIQEPKVVSTEDGLSLFNCSIPHFAKFAHHFNCNLAVDCAEAEDEVQCPYSSPDCGPGFIDAGDKCYEYTRVRTNTSWSYAYTYCHGLNRTLVNPSDPSQWEWFKDVIVRYGRKTSVTFTGLRTSQSSVAEVPSLYRDMLQWSDSTMALYANITSQTRSVPFCSRFLPEVSQFNLVAIGCLEVTDGRIACEKRKSSFGRRRSQLSPSLTKSNYSWFDANVSLPVASCPSEHVVRDFLACDQQSWCQSTRHGQACDTKGISMFQCVYGTQSVHYTLTCDFRIDCPDGSDEDFCKHPQCREDKCSSGECIASGERCDGMQHCDDGSDENCPQVIKFVPPVPPPTTVRFDGRGGYSLQPLSDDDPCPDTHFRCVSSNYCLPLYVRCNNVYDCPDHEDEAGCETFQCPGYFRCRGSAVCLHPKHLCDGAIQCPQHDDELLCDLDCPKGCFCQGLAFVCKQQISPSDFPSLRYLDASGSDMKMEAVAYNDYLIYIILANCHIEDILHMDLKNLRTLDLSYNLLTTLELDSFLHLNNLRNLYLVGNPLVTMVAFTSPSTKRNAFRYINLSGTLLETINATIFSGFPETTVVNFSKSQQLSSITEDGFKTLPGLVVVDLTDCPRLASYPTDLLRHLTHLVSVYADDYRLCCKAALPDAFNPDSCHAPTDDIASCDDLLRSDIFRVFLWAFAVLAVLGNASSFFTRFYIQNESFQSSFNVFVTNLSVADFLMGIYLTVIGAADQVYKGRYLWQGDAWKNNVACQTAGFLSLLSTEVSAFFICLITLDRFLVLRFPFSKVHFSKKSALVACGFAWFAGFVLAVVPLLPMTSHWKFYSQTGICIPLPFFSKEDRFPGHTYSFGVMILLNLLLFLLIAVGQIVIYTAVKSGTQMKRKSSRDVAIARRLTTIVLSDFICWFPIGLMGLLAYTGTPIPTDVNVGVAIFVLPFNSALNPFLYTFNIVMEKRRKAVEARMLQRLETRHVTEMSQLPGQLTVTKETALNQIEGWLGVRVITLSDLAARFDMAPRMHDVEPSSSGKTLNDVS